MIYKIVDETDDWQKICQRLFQLRELAQTTGAYAYVFASRRLKDQVSRLVRDLDLEDRVHFVDLIAEIPDSATDLPQTAR